MLSACAYGGVLAYTVAHSVAAAPGTAAIGSVGALVLVFLLVRADAELVAWPIGLLGAAYTIALVVSLAAAPAGGGLAWTVLGAASAVAVVTLAVRLARRT